MKNVNIDSTVIVSVDVNMKKLHNTVAFKYGDNMTAIYRLQDILKGFFLPFMLGDVEAINKELEEMEPSAPLTEDKAKEAFEALEAMAVIGGSKFNHVETTLRELMQMFFKTDDVDLCNFIELHSATLH